MKKEISIYLAGLFDGEGTFSLFKRPSKKATLGFELQPYIEMSSTDEDIIKWLADIFDNSYFFNNKRKKESNKKQAYKWHLTGYKNIISFIEGVLPYLRIKKEVATVLLGYCKRRKDVMKKPLKKRGYTEEDLKDFKKIRKLNKRGI